MRTTRETSTTPLLFFSGFTSRSFFCARAKNFAKVFELLTYRRARVPSFPRHAFASRLIFSPFLQMLLQTVEHRVRVASRKVATQTRRAIATGAFAFKFSIFITRCLPERLSRNTQKTSPYDYIFRERDKALDGSENRS